jgi:ankyrin repeat protein
MLMALFCSACGTQLPDEAVFCFKCGKPLGTPAPLSQWELKKLEEKLSSPIINGNIDEVRRLLEKSPLLANGMTSSYTSALKLAVDRDKKEIVRLLLENGADTEYTNTGNPPPLFVAKSPAVASLLIAHGANVNRIDREKTPLNSAITDDRYDVIRVLLESGADPNLPSNEKDTPLCLALQWKRTEMVRLLLDKGADPNRRNNRGDTPLHKAVLSDQLVLVELLLNKGANPKIKDANGRLPYSSAKIRAIKELLESRGGGLYRYEI